MQWFSVVHACGERLLLREMYWKDGRIRERQWCTTRLQQIEHCPTCGRAVVPSNVTIERAIPSEEIAQYRQKDYYAGLTSRNDGTSPERGILPMPPKDSYIQLDKGYHGMRRIAMWRLRAHQQDDRGLYGASSEPGHKHHEHGGVPGE